MEKADKNKSFVREIMAYLAVLTGILIGVLVFFIGVSYQILQTEIESNTESFLDIYSSEFSNSIGKLDGILRSITSQGEALARIQSEKDDERVPSSVYLQQYMSTLLGGDNEADAVVVYDASEQVCLDAVTAHISYRQKQLLREYTAGILENPEISSFTWTFLDLEGDVYLCKILKNEVRAIAVFADTAAMMQSLSGREFGNRSLLLSNPQGNIGKAWGEDAALLEQAGNLEHTDTSQYYTDYRELVADQLWLFCYTSRASVWHQVSSGMAAAALFVGIVVLFSLFLYRYARREIAAPMERMVQDMERIGEGQYENRIEEEFRAREFQVLENTTNRMLDEIIGLKIQTYEKRIALQDVELRSIRLQLKPHFFLNALSTISSLNTQGQEERIRRYIAALSKNVRYMFRAGFHTVPIREELRHVNHYLEMQEMIYPDCVFFLCDMPEECSEWEVPQMLIHTFIENEFKHAVIPGEMLTILVKIQPREYDGEKMLCIEIEDDGCGYPEQVLAYMNQELPDEREPGHQVGLWSVKRMTELMYERTGLIRLENVQPHGCLSRIHIPQQPRHSRTEGRSRQQGKGIE